MGFPGIVEFARNFAVMVRIQGPDPKGLKMRKHAFHHYSSGKTTLSASGMLFPGFSLNASRVKQIGRQDNKPSLGDSVIVFTVASVIEPFLSQQDRKNISKVNLLNMLMQSYEKFQVYCVSVLKVALKAG